jgi:hypothetical protein
MEQKRYQPLPPKSRLLDPDEIGVDGAEHGIDGQAETLNHCNADDGDQTDEQAVFSKRCAGLIIGQTSDLFVHIAPHLRFAYVELGTEAGDTRFRSRCRFSDARKICVNGAENGVDRQAETFDHCNTDNGDQADE